MLFSSFCKRVLVFVFIAAALASGKCTFAANIESQFGKKEVEYGKEAAAQVAKDYKLSTNDGDLKRVRAIGEKLAAMANKSEVAATYGSSKVCTFEYKFNVIEDPDVNAFSLPGGSIYINTGLLKFVQSDQELAAVIAHEVTHASHHHMVYLLSKQASLNNIQAATLLAIMLSGGKGSDLANVALGVQLYQTAKLNGYSQEAERDADHGAILYLKSAGYNPVGLLTFLERLSKRPELINYGIYRTHPLDADRVKATKKLLTELKVPIKRRETTDAAKAEVKIDKVGGIDTPSIYIKDTLIVRPAAQDGKTQAQRAQDISGRINAALDDCIELRDLTSNPEEGTIISRGSNLLTITDSDANLTGKSRTDATKDAYAAIRLVLWKQMIDTVQ